MRIVGVIAFLVLLAGCADNATVDGTDEEGTDTETGGPGQDMTGDDTTDPTTSENVTAMLLADVLNGTAPLQVNLTLNGTGDGLNWTLSINGTEVANGTTLPANFTHTFTQVGNVSVRLDVTSGNRTASDNLTIAVEAPAVAGDPNAGLPEPVTISGTVTQGVHVDGMCFTSYPTFSPDLWGWNYEMDSGWATEWWEGEDTLTPGGASGTVPENTDNVGACRTETVAAGHPSWSITIYHPDWVV